MYTITPDSPSLQAGDQNCVTITWPPGTSSPTEVVADITSPRTFKPVVRQLPGETAENSVRICFDIPADATMVVISVRPTIAGSATLVLT